MADTDNDNDEYQFSELDSLENEPMMESDYQTQEQDIPIHGVDTSEENHIIRNSLIAIGILILAIITYKFIGGLFTSTSTTKTAQTPVSKVPAPATDANVVPQTPQPGVTNNTEELEQKLNALEISQQSLKSDMSDLSDKLNNMDNGTADLSAQVDKLNQAIANLSDQLDSQSRQISVLMTRTKPKPVRRTKSQAVQRITYNLQAVIPGRAWLIGSNGTTLTVSTGARISGYGTVTLIDSLQGRVITSSGRVITFSREES